MDPLRRTHCWATHPDLLCYIFSTHQALMCLLIARICRHYHLRSTPLGQLSSLGRSNRDIQTLQHESHTPAPIQLQLRVERIPIIHLPLSEPWYSDTSQERTFSGTLTNKKCPLRFLPIARTLDLYPPGGSIPQTMFSPLKSLFPVCCGCGPLHAEDVRFLNGRRISGLLVSIAACRAKAYSEPS